jgi:hypothetical protein
MERPIAGGCAMEDIGPDNARIGSNQAGDQPTRCIVKFSSPRYVMSEARLVPQIGPSRPTILPCLLLEPQRPLATVDNLFDCNSFSRPYAHCVPPAVKTRS